MASSWDEERPDDPRPLREALGRYLHHLGAPPVDVVAELGRRWPVIVGPALADVTHPLEVADGVLVIGCDDTALAAQVAWMEHQIVERYVAEFDDWSVRRVIVRRAS